MAVRFAMPWNAYTELLSSYDYLDRLFARSYKAEKDRRVLS